MEPPKAVPKKKSSKETPAKKIKLEPEWMRGDGRTVVSLILSVQKSDINHAKVMTELTKLYNSVRISLKNIANFSLFSCFRWDTKRSCQCSRR